MSTLHRTSYQSPIARQQEVSCQKERKEQKTISLTSQIREQNEKIVCYLRRGNEYKGLTAREFTLHTRSLFTHQITAKPTALQEFWTNNCPSTDFNPIDRWLQEHFFQEYQILKAKPDPYKIAFHPQRRRKAFAIEAMEDIPAFKTLGFLSGKFAYSEENKLVTPADLYYASSPKKETNLYGMIQDGLPNCFLFLLHTEPVPIYLIVSLTTIKKGKELGVARVIGHKRGKEFLSPIIEYYRAAPLSAFSQIQHSCLPIHEEFV